MPDPLIAACVELEDATGLLFITRPDGSGNVRLECERHVGRRVSFDVLTDWMSPAAMLAEIQRRLDGDPRALGV